MLFSFLLSDSASSCLCLLLTSRHWGESAKALSVPRLCKCCR